jgi:hypothetical protein
MTELVLGAVAYDQKVVPIWDGFLQYFRARDLPFDYVLFSSYERQVEEGLKARVPGRVSGYTQLSEAVDRFGTIDTFARSVEAACK